MSGRRGMVSLVGAGPGDPGLLTRRAVLRLRHADLVLYDALVSADIVALARRAQRFSVGKRCGRPSISQESINRLMIRAAQRGRRVVRLKAGDPFVLGRGGEEALALRAAGIPFEIVPGLSSALAAPALAGIPVTHRGLSAGFLVVSGHSESTYRPVLESLPANSLTLVILMGLGSVASIVGTLRAAGWTLNTPSAVLFAAGTPEASAWHGTLADLPSCRAGAPADAPGTIVVGEVVSLAALLGASAGAPGMASLPSRPESAAAEAVRSRESHVSHG